MIPHPRFPLVLLAFSCLGAAMAQPAPASQDDPVVFVLEGKPWRKSEWERMIASLPPEVGRNFQLNREAFLKQYALVLRLARLAEQDGVPAQEPHRTRLEYNRLVYLAQAETEVAAMKLPITHEDELNYFADHKDDWARAHVKVIYLSFNDNPLAAAGPNAKRPRTSAEAEKLARDLVARARAGADFAELARKFSDDEETRLKGGDYQPLKPNDSSLPPAIRTAVFSLRPGQVSDPVRQTGGFWIFQLKEFATPSFEEVRGEVFQALREAKFKQWIEGVQKSLEIDIKDPQYMQSGSPQK